MKRYNTLCTIALAAAVVLLAGCNNNKSHTEEADSAAVEALCNQLVEPDPNPLPEEEPLMEPEEEVSAPQPAPAPKPVVKKETIYISTHGAQGEVYGTVTMNGNTGRGTIHDEHENTLSITVTRKGNELFGVDQNSRQYVFKL